MLEIVQSIENVREILSNSYLQLSPLVNQFLNPFLFISKKEEIKLSFFTKSSLKIVKVSWITNHHNPLARRRNISSLHGSVRPPIGCWYPNSSSALRSNSWNEGWLSNDIGTTYLFFSPSPTYTAKWPLGTSTAIEETACFAVKLDPLRICLACTIPGKRIAMFKDQSLKMGFFFFLRRR